MQTATLKESFDFPMAKRLNLHIDLIQFEPYRQCWEDVYSINYIRHLSWGDIYIIMGFHVLRVANNIVSGNGTSKYNPAWYVQSENDAKATNYVYNIYN